MEIFLYKADIAMKRTKQRGGVYFWLYGIAYWMPIQQKLAPLVLLFSDFAGWDSWRSERDFSVQVDKMNFQKPDKVFFIWQNNSNYLTGLIVKS